MKIKKFLLLLFLVFGLVVSDSVLADSASPTFTISPFTQTSFTAGESVPVSWTVENPSGGRIVYFVLANSSGVRVPGVQARPFARTTLLASDSAFFSLPRNLPNNSYRLLVYFIPTSRTSGATVVKTTDVFTVGGGGGSTQAAPSLTSQVSGDVSAFRAPNDNESATRIVIAGQEEVLAKFRFTARNEAMIVNKFQILITDGKNGTAFTAGAVDEAPVIKLYDGATQIGNPAGYAVTASGASAGAVVVDGLNWSIPANGNKTLTVKGVLNTIAQGADAGSLVYAILLNRGFEALGSVTKDTTIQIAHGNPMAVYKARPVISLPTQGDYRLGAGENPVLRFRVTANSGDVSWKKIQFNVRMAGAVMSAVSAAPGTTGNVKVRDLTITNSNLNIAAAMSNNSLRAQPSINRSINSGGSGFVTFILSQPEEISAGQYKDYELSLTFENVSAAAGGASISIRPYSGELSNSRRGDLGKSVSLLEGRVDGVPSFIWSDNSALSHSETSSDWFEGTSFVTGLLPSFRTVTSAGGGGGGGGGGGVSVPATPSLSVALSATPTSQTYVRGAQNVPLVGLVLRAQSGDVRVTDLRLNAVAVSGILSPSEVQNLALYDGSTRISSELSLSSDLSVVFSDLNLTIRAGQAKTLVLKGNISANAGGGDAYAFYLNAFNLNGVNYLNVSATDTNGNSFLTSGAPINSNRSVLMRIIEIGDVSVARAADDAESAAGIIIAGREEVLAKLRFTARNEEMTVQKMRIWVGNGSDAAYDEIPVIKLYDGSTQIGNAAGYPVTASGADAGTVFIDELNWRIPKDGNKTLTIKGVVNTIVSGADSGSFVYVTFLNGGFEAQGATAKDTTIGSVPGNQKIVYKTKPIITLPTQPYGKLGAGKVRVFRFRVAADSAYDVSWKKITFQVTMTGAKMVAPDAAPGTTGNVEVMNLDWGSPLNIASASGQQILGGSNGLVSIVLANEESISAGSFKDYELSLTFADLFPNPGSAYAITKIALAETDVVAGASFADVERSGASFIWSDNSSTSHSETTSDWANGRYVKDLPSLSKTMMSDAGSSPVFRFASILKSVLWALGN